MNKTLDGFENWAREVNDVISLDLSKLDGHYVSLKTKEFALCWVSAQHVQLIEDKHEVSLLFGGSNVTK